MRVRGAWLVPPAVAARFAILCAILRHVHLVLHIALFTRELARLRPRAFVVDQLSAALPLLRCACPRVPVLFYCHFPDLLLARGRDASALKRLYRVPFDRLEQWSMAFAHAVAVNSHFTRRVVERTWPGLARAVPIHVVYPCVDTEPPRHGDAAAAAALAPADRLILSINRFERKKDIGLAVRAFAAIPAAERQRVRLVVAGTSRRPARPGPARATGDALTASPQAATTTASPKTSPTTPSCRRSPPPSASPTTPSRPPRRSPPPPPTPTSSSSSPCPTPSRRRCSPAPRCSSTRPPTSTLASCRSRPC